ncbi:MAG: hypothetical protein JWM90_705 [Thermoleophilia bacterium]|nr:hypothetical protein [Thermoleophilia bacterium]
MTPDGSSPKPGSGEGGSSEERARRAADEYRRALLEYTQLMRHRLMNPLTAITGTLETILDLDLDRPTQHELLRAALDKAQELRHVVLTPEIRTGVEADLDPLPRATSEDTFLHQVAATQKMFQRENERSVASFEVLDSVHEFMCECAVQACSTVISMSLRDFYRVHEDPRAGVIKPGHELAVAEEVIERHEHWWVVRKHDNDPQNAAIREHHRILDSGLPPVWLTPGVSGFHAA